MSDAKNPFSHWVNVAQARLGAGVVYATDEFFGAKERLIDAHDPVFVADRYDDHGKWMDGWETRRRRDAGYDHCIIRLGKRSTVHGVDIDTSHFTGNHPPRASIDACVSVGDLPPADAAWTEILPVTNLQGNSHRFLEIRDQGSHTHVRLNIYPDGGVARLRVYGQIRPNWESSELRGRVDLVALVNGGRALAASDEHFGSMHNLNAPGRGVNMGDGWETARRRGPGHDWVVIALGHEGVVDEIEIDTAHFKGNFPDRASVQAACVREDVNEAFTTQGQQWETLLPETKLAADTVHAFRDELRPLGLVTHLRLNIFPDGGISRLRVFGRALREGL